MAKPTREAQPVQVKVAVKSVAEKAYGDYVKGRPINAIAAEMKLEPSEVLSMITTIEAGRAK